VRKLKITIIYDAVEEALRQKTEAESKKKVSLVCEQVEQALTRRGHEVKKIAAEKKMWDFATRIGRDDADLIFNLCESIGGVSQYEQAVAALLELLGKKFTGTGSMGLALAQDKELSKKIYRFHGIRYPKFLSMESCKVGWADDLSFPLFVKPLNEDASIGIDRDSVVHNVKELMEKISYIQTELKASALIEEFIEGREIYIGIIGNDKPEALPILEWDFSKVPDGIPKIASSEAKWDEESPYKDAPEIFPTDIPEPVCKRIQEAAVQAFKALKLRDYGRVDMRLRQVTPMALEEKSKGPEKSTGVETATTELDTWEFYVIEVNPNPYLDKKSELAMAAQKHGLIYPDLIEKIIELAMARNVQSCLF
jgi:D-alanine-D-alanine ligase